MSSLYPVGVTKIAFEIQRSSDMSVLVDVDVTISKKVPSS